MLEGSYKSMVVDTGYEINMTPSPQWYNKIKLFSKSKENRRADSWALIPAPQLAGNWGSV